MTDGRAVQCAACGGPNLEPLGYQAAMRCRDCGAHMARRVVCTPPRSQPPGPKTLRDEIAMAALTGIMSVRNTFPSREGDDTLGECAYGPEAAVDLAYEVADVAMQKREKPRD